MTDLFTTFTTRLDAVGVESMVTGSVASSVFGEARIGDDIDFVIAIDDEHIAAFVDAFPEPEFCCPPALVLGIEAARTERGHFVIVQRATGFAADFYLMGRDPFAAWAMSHRRELHVGGNTLQIAPIEYVILHKLDSYRAGRNAKHIEDIRGMLRHSPDAIDAAELGRMIAARGLAPEWSAVDAP